MARKKIDIRIRLERQEKKIIRLSEQLEQAKEEYEGLLKEQKEEDKKKLVEAYEKSRRSLEEVLEFMKGKADI